jgi:hypothetical protein
MAADGNPFATPLVDAAAVPTSEIDSEAERVRKDHIGKEASIKAIGALALLGGALSVGVGIFLLRLWEQARENGRLGLFATLVLGIVAGGIINLVGGLQLRRLRSNGRVLVTAALGLSVLMGLTTAENAQETGQAIGRMLIPTLIIASLWGAKATTVLSDHYRLEIIPRTPHVKYRTPRWIWWLLGLLVLVVLLAAIGGARR